MNSMNRKPQMGVGLVEIMVAVTVSLLLLAGMVRILIGNKQTFQAQNMLQGLQEDTRAAITMLSDVIANAGFHINPLADPAELFDPANNDVDDPPNNHVDHLGNAVIDGEASGANPHAVPDRFTVSFQSDGSMFDCLGDTYGPGSATPLATPANLGLIRNTFYLDGGALRCSVTVTSALGTATPKPQPLVNNVESMAVRYGVDTNLDESVDQYLWAEEVNALGQWENVRAIKLALLIASEDAVRSVAETNPFSFSLLGAPLAVADDRHARHVITRVIALNNRLHQTN